MTAPSRALAETRDTVQRLLDCLPDSRMQDDPCWTWAWNELDDDAQVAVKGARVAGRALLVALDAEPQPLDRETLASTYKDWWTSQGQSMTWDRCFACADFILARLEGRDSK